MKKIFQYSLLDAFLFLYTVSLIILPMYMAVYTSMSVWWVPIGLVHSYLIANLQNTSLHHQSHWPMFASKKLNSYYEIVLSSVSGLTHQGWKKAHTLHHKHVNDHPADGRTKDPTSVYQGGKNGQPINVWIYTVNRGFQDLLNYLVLIKMRFIGIKKFDDQYRKESIAGKLFFLLIAMINFKYAILLLVVYFFAFMENRAIAYGAHWGVLERRGDTTQDAISVKGFWYNLLGFGLGYHQEHHHKPGVHWTRYKEVTPLLSPDRKFIKGYHLTNNPFWLHFKLLFKKSK